MNVLKESNHTAMLEGSFITLSVVSTDGACGGVGWWGVNAQDFKKISDPKISLITPRKGPPA